MDLLYRQLIYLIGVLGSFDLGHCTEKTLSQFYNLYQTGHIRIEGCSVAVLTDKGHEVFNDIK
jgi:hypothetical protein